MAVNSLRQDRRSRPLFAGKWVVERVLGQGGMGMVYAARHARLGHRVALKVLGEGLREHTDLVARFEREARAASSLTSPHAVKVFDIDVTEDRTPFLVMELLEGADLGRILDQEGPQPVGRAVAWLRQACDAIAEAHRRGIVHRDLKPSNLFLARIEDGRLLVKVLDFGIAKRLASASRERALTGDVAPLGTPHYMSPEQVRCAKDVDARSDVWSLGVTLFELLTGETPYMQVEASACIAAIAADPVRDPRVLRPELPDELVHVLLKALAKNPAERFADAAAFADALAPFAAPEEEALEASAVVRLGTRARAEAAAAASAPKPRLVLDTTMTEEESAPPSPMRAPMPAIVGPDLLGPVRPARPAFRSEETVPPAISRREGFVAARGRRVRHVAAAACVAAIFGTVLLPKCVGKDAARANEVTTAHAVTTATSLGNAMPAAPAAHVDPAPATVEVTSARVGTPSPVEDGAPSEVHVAKASGPKSVVASTPTSAPRARKKGTPATRAALASTATAPGDEPAAEVATTPVHGGLRGPGF